MLDECICHSGVSGLFCPWLFSEKNVEVWRGHAKTLTFFNISVITEDVYRYLKLTLIITIKKGTHSSRGGDPQNFFHMIMPPFRLGIF